MRQLPGTIPRSQGCRAPALGFAAPAGAIPAREPPDGGTHAAPAIMGGCDCVRVAVSVRQFFEFSGKILAGRGVPAGRA
ncbi:protein of unknown function [Rhodovastum atsumiense]|nr:protein of unknown function [Rhodovastum atsumiense]